MAFNARLAALKDLIAAMDKPDAPEAPVAEETAEVAPEMGDDGKGISVTKVSSDVSPEDAEKLKELLAKLGAA